MNFLRPARVCSLKMVLEVQSANTRSSRKIGFLGEACLPRQSTSRKYFVLYSDAMKGDLLSSSTIVMTQQESNCLLSQVIITVNNGIPYTASEYLCILFIFYVLFNHSLLNS